MKFAALALDYDGTIAVEGVFDPAVREAVAELRCQGIVVILVTGRRLPDLHQVAGDLTCFDVIIAENGAVLEFPSSGRHVVAGHAPHPMFLQELTRRGVPFSAGESVVEAHAKWAEVILEMCRPQPCTAVSPDVFRDLQTTEAALLPGAEEAHGHVCRFQLAPRLTSHVRHRTKYLDMPVSNAQVFVFTENGRPGARARTLKELTGLLATFPADHVAGHLRRHDFSRWIDDVFRDHLFAAHLRKVEGRVESDDVREVAEAIGQAIRARYDTADTRTENGTTA